MEALTYSSAHLFVILLLVVFLFILCLSVVAQIVVFLFFFDMPQPKSIPPTLCEALMEAFQATVTPVRPELQKQVILVDSAASTARKSTFYTEDVDILAPKPAIQDIGRRILEGAGPLQEVADKQIAYNTSEGIRTHVGIIKLP